MFQKVRKLVRSRLFGSRPQDWSFLEDSYNGKRSLRCYITDTAGLYSLPVVARNLRESYRAGGIASVNKNVPKSGNLHVRVGLARAWSGQQGKCYVMINGVYW